MSVNVYLKGEEVQKLEGFTIRKRQGGKPIQEWDEYEVPGVKLFRDKGRWFVMLSESDPVPEAVKDIVEEISFHAIIPRLAAREAGIYRHESAKAKVKPWNSGHEWKLEIRIEGKEMEDIRELFHKIEVGSIRPEESYEGPQSGKSRADLEAELERMRQELRDANDALKSLKAYLSRFSLELEAERWPFCTKERVASMIRAYFIKHSAVSTIATIDNRRA